MQLCYHFSQIPVVYFKEYLNENGHGNKHH